MREVFLGGASRPRIDGLAGTKTDGRKKTGGKIVRGGGQTERQVVSVGVTSFED